MSRFQSKLLKEHAKNSIICPGWVTWLVGALSHAPRGCGYDPQSRHVQEATDQCFSFTSMFLSNPLPLSLKHKKSLNISSGEALNLPPPSKSELGWQKTINRSSTLSEILESSNEDFKAVVLRMFQWAITNTLETNEGVTRYKEQTAGQDGGVGRYTLPPWTTKRTTTNLKTTRAARKSKCMEVWLPRS